MKPRLVNQPLRAELFPQPVVSVFEGLLQSPQILLPLQAISFLYLKLLLLPSQALSQSLIFFLELKHLARTGAGGMKEG